MANVPTRTDFERIAHQSGLEITRINEFAPGRFQVDLCHPQTKAHKRHHIRVGYSLLSKEVSPGEWQFHSSGELPNITTVRKLEPTPGKYFVHHYEIALPHLQ